MNEIRLHIIPTANDDGSEASTVSADQIFQAVKVLNVIYQTANIQFIFDPQSDIDPIRRNTLLNHDYTVSPDANTNSPKDIKPPFDESPHLQEKNRIAKQYPGKLVIYYASGNRWIYNDEKNKWEFKPKNFHWSNDFDSFVEMCAGFDNAWKLAHEIGHYLHLVHPFRDYPNTVMEAAEIIRSYVEDSHHSKEDGAKVFDGDFDSINDTPPDPGPTVFVDAGLDPCNPDQGVISLTVKFREGDKTYPIAPDRENIMNYWDQTCRGKPAQITGNQALKVRRALEVGNRNHLIVRRTLFNAICEETSSGQTSTIGLTKDEFAVRFDRELAHGRNVKYMQAYAIENGEIRWNGVWQPGSSPQARAICWAFSDFVSRFDRELARGKHPVHMQAYDIGGDQIFWDGVWEFGDKNQSRALCWSLGDFAKRFDAESSQGKHFVHMQAYDIGGGQIRWDGVWEPGDKKQTRALHWSFNDFVARYNEEITAGRHIVHMQAYDIGSGQTGWDGVWEPGDKKQTRALGLTRDDFAIFLNEQVVSNKHVTHIQAY